MDIKTIVKSALNKVYGRTKPVDPNEFLKSKLATSVTVAKPYSTTSVMNNITSGAHITSLPNYTTVIGGQAGVGQLYSAGAAGGAGTTMNTQWVYPSTKSTGYTLSGNSGISVLSDSLMTLYGTDQKEIVRLNKDGSVTWADGINIDDAADAFGRSMALGAENIAGVTYGVKQRIRDAVFEELIDMAKSKETLTADDLTYMQQAAKIMDKLKGIK